MRCCKPLLFRKVSFIFLILFQCTDIAISGWCGNSTDYCSASVGCQSAYGTCDNSTTSSGSGTGGISTNNQCGPGFGTCASNQCCSLAGFCGTTEGICSFPRASWPLTEVSQITVQPLTASLTTVQHVMPTWYLRGRIPLQSPEIYLDQCYTVRLASMTASTQEIWL